MAVTGNSGERGSESCSKSGVQRAVDAQNAALKNAAAIKKSMIDVAAIEARRKRFERCILGGTVALLMFVGFVIWYQEGRLFQKGVRILQSFESEEKNPSKSAELNCQHPKNRNTPYCQDRTADSETTWNSIVKHDKRSPAFTLHGR